MTKLSDNARRVLGDKPAVTLEEFDRIWSIWPFGHKEDTYIEVAYAVAFKTMLDGSPITFDDMVKKYGSYVEIAKARTTDPDKFVAKLINWVKKARYNESTEKPSTKRIDRLVK